MKKFARRLSLACLLLSLLLTSCQKNDPSTVIDSSPDSSRPIEFSDSYNLTAPNPCVLYDITVGKIFNSTYSYNSSYDCLVLECTIQNIFYQAPTYEGEIWARNGDSILVWIDIKYLQADVVSALCDLLESLDAAIIYGSQLEHRVFEDSPDFKKWEEELGKDNISLTQYYDGRYMLELPPNVVIHWLPSWHLLPIIDGKFDADSIATILGPSNMAFDINIERPEGLLYFKNGDSLEDVYAALDKYVTKFS